jgi:hypothetical protein
VPERVRSEHHEILFDLHILTSIVGSTSVAEEVCSLLNGVAPSSKIRESRRRCCVGSEGCQRCHTQQPACQDMIANHLDKAHDFYFGLKMSEAMLKQSWVRC